MYIIENETLGLRPYTHFDDKDMYACWQDIDTQKGYNGVFNQSFDEFVKFDISRFKFWVTVIHKRTGESIGTLRLGLDETCPDLAIWIYPKFRGHGYGTASFGLALHYLFEHFDYQELSAGCYWDNANSLQMLSRLGFVRYPEGDETEINCFTGAETKQYEFRISRDVFMQTHPTV